MDKTEQKLTVREGKIFKHLRFQAYGKGEIHVHDDKSGLIFKMKDKMVFYYMAKSLLNATVGLGNNQIIGYKRIIFLTDKGGSANLVCGRVYKGGYASWNLYLEQPTGVKEVDKIMPRPTKDLLFLDDFINRHI